MGGGMGWGGGRGVWFFVGGGGSTSKNLPFHTININLQNSYKNSWNT